MSRKQYEKEVKEKLEELASEIDQLRAHLKQMEDELDDEHHEAFAKLHELQEDTRRIFHELVEASDESYESAKAKMEDYWSSLGREIKAFDRKIKDHF